MIRFLAVALFCLAMVLTACAPGSWYRSHPTTKDLLIQKMGEPYRVIRTDDGTEKLIYRFQGDGVTFMYWLIENDMVVRSGMM